MNKFHFHFFTAVGIFFYIIATLHVVRILFSWPVIIGEQEVPLWISWATAVAASYLGWKIIVLSA